MIAYIGCLDAAPKLPCFCWTTGMSPHSAAHVTSWVFAPACRWAEWRRTKDRSAALRFDTDDAERRRWFDVARRRAGADYSLPTAGRGWWLVAGKMLRGGGDAIQLLRGSKPVTRIHEFERNVLDTLEPEPSNSLVVSVTERTWRAGPRRWPITNGRAMEEGRAPRFVLATDRRPEFRSQMFALDFLHRRLWNGAWWRNCTAGHRPGSP